jgi:ribosomal protein L37AE/L43A
VFVSDLRHYLDIADDLVDSPATRLGRQLGLIVQAATSRDTGERWVTALACPRRPNRQRCTGTVEVARIGASINWECTACRDNGTISGWENSTFDIRVADPEMNALGVDTALVSVMITKQVAVTLQALPLLESDLERVVFQTAIVDDLAVLVCSENQLEELAEHVAAEANHAPNRRHQKLLDTAYEVLNAASP